VSPLCLVSGYADFWYLSWTSVILGPLETACKDSYCEIFEHVIPCGWVALLGMGM
jgi:hypothetical protein